MTTADTTQGQAVAAFDMTPTWGEVGLLLWRLAVSKELKALEAGKSEFQKAFAGMEVLNQLLRTLTPEQRTLYERVFAEELAKQDRR